MEIITIIQTATGAFLNSYFFAALQIFFGIYTIVLIIDIVLILSFRNFDEIRKQRSFGSEFVPSLSQAVMIKQWSKIEDRLKTGNVSEYKVAILEADNIAEGILTDIGYKGDDMAQKIEQLRMIQAEDAIILDGVHQIRNRIVFEQDFNPDLEQTKNILDTYKDYLKKFDYFQ